MLAQRAAGVNSSAFYLYMLLLMAHIGLVWTLPYFPTQDGPSHLYNLAILSDLLHGGQTWGQFYSYKLQAVPNLAFHLIAYPLLQFFPPLITEKIFLTIYIMLMGGCAPFLLHSFDKTIFPVSFLVFPVIFNFDLMMGFYSYTIAVPLFLLAASLSWRLRDGSASRRFIIFNLMGLMLFFLHLIPFVFFVIFIGLMLAIYHEDHATSPASIVMRLLMITPLIIMLMMQLASGETKAAQDFSYLFSASRAAVLVAELFLFSTASTSMWQLVPAAMLIFSLYELIRRGRNRRMLSGAVTASTKLLDALVITLLAIYFTAPFYFGGGSYFNSRLPWVILLVSLPLLELPAPGSGKPGSLVAVAFVFLAANSMSLWQQSERVKSFLSGMHVGIPKGAMVVVYSRKTSPWPRQDPLLHAISYYCISNQSVDMANYETGFTYFPVHFHRSLPSLPLSEPIARHFEAIDWRSFTSKQFVYGWSTGSSDEIKLMAHFQKVWAQGELSIWESKSGSAEPE